MSGQERGARKQATHTVGVEGGKLSKATGVQDSHLQVKLVNQVLHALWMPAGQSAEDRDAAINAALAALIGIVPTDAVEGLLAGQMVATHNAAMECLRRAQIEGQSFEGRDQNLKHASKLLALYARQLEALDKHRGRGQQKITVEHVTVNAGGQAIVGNVDAGGKSASNPTPEAPLALPDDSAQPMQIIDAAAFVREKRKAKARGFDDSE